MSFVNAADEGAWIALNPDSQFEKGADSCPIV